MSAALNGNLQDFGIAEVFQLIGQQCKTGMLEIRHGDRTMQLVFDQGAVVWASLIGATEHSELGDRLVRCGLLTRQRLNELMIECEDSARSLPALAVTLDVVAASDIEEIRELLTHDSIFEVLRWQQGSFHFSAQPVQHDRPADKLLGAERILMDGMRMVDEWQTFCELVPSEDLVFQRIGRIEDYRQQASGEARHRISQAERVLELVDGRLSVRRVVDLSRLGTFDATRILSELCSAGCIRLVAGDRARSRRRASKGNVASGSNVSAWALGVAPVLLLLMVVGVIFAKRPDPMVGMAIDRNPLEAARLEFETRRLRHALEAQRFLVGDWPEDLRGADQTGLLGGGSLTPSTHAPYYYARRAGGLVLLAPEH